jgi:hypothetical protein
MAPPPEPGGPEGRTSSEKDPLPSTRPMSKSNCMDPQSNSAPRARESQPNDGAFHGKTLTALTESGAHQALVEVVGGLARGLAVKRSLPRRFHPQYFAIRTGVT